MKKYGYTETRHISYYDLRSACIRENWCNAATCEEYSALLQKADDMQNVTSDDLVELATAICELTSGVSIQDDEYFCNVMFILANDVCRSVFDKDK